MNSQDNKILDFEELKDKYGPKKEDNLLLGSVYHELGYINRAMRVNQCGSYLEFAHEFDLETGIIEDKGRLHSANFCRDPLCPMCNWRKSLKQIAQLSSVMNHEDIKDKYGYIFITLTIPNVTFDNLSAGVNKCLHSFDRLMKRKRYKDVIKGYFRSLEVTVNNWKHTFHPHLHVLCLVPTSYGKKTYISHDQLLNDWREVTRDQSITQVDIRRVKHQSDTDGHLYDISSAALEVAKYAAKLTKRSYEPEIINNLLLGLSSRRTSSYGGVMKSVFAKLKLEDIESADLIHINDDVPSPVIQYIVCYGWTPSGYQVLNSRLEGINDDELSVC